MFAITTKHKCLTCNHPAFEKGGRANAWYCDVHINDVGRRLEVVSIGENFTKVLNSSYAVVNQERELYVSTASNMPARIGDQIDYCDPLGNWSWFQVHIIGQETLRALEGPGEANAARWIVCAPPCESTDAS